MQQLRPGDTVGGEFQILRQLGSGGMGSVYLCQQRSTEKVRALKVMHERFSKDASFVERFEREARIGARIQSQHIVEVVAAGIDEGLSIPWLAMEYLDGLTLTDAVARFGPPGKADGTLLTDHLWHAMCAAHRANIVHRDLKPDNLFLAAAHSPGRAFELKVLDFGIAKWLNPAQVQSTLRVLTHGWGAPEQAIPGAPIGTQADVWAIGLVVFWLLTGHSFWHDPDNIERVQVQVFNLPIPPGSTRARELNVTPLAPDFDAWFAKCVTRDQTQRYANAVEAFAAWKRLKSPWSLTARSWQEAAFALARSPTDVASASPSAQASERTNVQLDTRNGTEPITPFDPKTLQHQTSVPLELVQAPAPAPITRRGLRWRSSAALTGLALVAVGATVAGWMRQGDTESMAARTEPSTSLISVRSHEPNPAASRVSVPPGMLSVPSGSFDFRQGNTQGLAATFVNLPRPYALDAREVTVSEYRECVVRSQCTEPAIVASAEVPANLIAQYEQLCNSRHTDRDAHPVNCVDFGQAQSYCSFRGKRLPTEIEWEFAARGSDNRVYPWGKQPPRGCLEAVVNGACPRERNGPPTRPAEQRSKTAVGPFGHIDLAGNLWEWVTDVGSVERSNATQIDDATNLATLRGGAWDQSVTLATTLSRSRLPTTHADVNVGMRCALDL